MLILEYFVCSINMCWLHPFQLGTSREPRGESSPCVPALILFVSLFVSTLAAIASSACRPQYRIFVSKLFPALLYFPRTSAVLNAITNPTTTFYGYQFRCSLRVGVSVSAFTGKTLSYTVSSSFEKSETGLFGGANKRLFGCFPRQTARERVRDQTEIFIFVS